MILHRTRLAVLPLGDRLIVTALAGNRVDAFVVDAAEPASALRAELDARKLRPRAVAVGLPRGAVVVKPIELPDVAGEIVDMVRFELERHLPFPAEDAPFDFGPLPAERGAGTEVSARRVLVAAGDRRVVDSALRIVQEAGLRPVSVTVAVHDLVAQVQTRRKSRVVWVHRVGPDADLLFLNGETLVLSRHVPAADEAGIASEIKRSFAVVRWRGCDAVWRSGDAPAAGGTTATLAGLGVPTTAPPWTPRARRLLARLPEDTRGALELALAVAAGRRSRTLDLIPPALKPKRLTRPQVITVGTGALAAGLAIAALLLPGYRDRQRLQALSTDIARLEPEVRAVERIRGELERRKKLLETMQSLEANTVHPLPMLRELTELIPNDAWLTLLTLDGKGVELTGQAATASALIPLLENSPRLERAEFASPVTRGRDREQFRILAKWEGAANGAAPRGSTSAAAPAANRATSAPPSPAPGAGGSARRPRAAAPDTDAGGPSEVKGGLSMPPKPPALGAPRGVRGRTGQSGAPRPPDSLTGSERDEGPRRQGSTAPERGR
ncbi:MAG: pilus assembly protein PilM [Candidatus Rokubacteria bacterium]|nr:pilus assembly protein PilM [Candidatus Rokubacteria bacterium]